MNNTILLSLELTPCQLEQIKELTISQLLEKGSVVSLSKESEPVAIQLFQIADFEKSATQTESDLGRMIYDRSKFPHAIQRMSEPSWHSPFWWTVEHYLDKYCRLDME